MCIILWWDSVYTFSGDASNLSIDDRAGGCFCEKLKNGGSVRHLEVVFADPGKTLRMIRGLGPLQAMAVAGNMTWSLSKIDSGTNVKVTYSVGGYRPGGLQKMASLVDKVMFEQLKRLKEYIEKQTIRK
jgi:transposase